jgi:hypothetical protein
VKKAYEAPAIRELGSLEELTAGTFNKVGKASDIFTQLTNGIVIGSLITSP